MILIQTGIRYLDLLPNTQLAITFTLSDLGEIKSRTASYSSNIRIPKTENNRAIFGYADSEKSNSTVVYTKLNCVVTIDGTTIPYINVIYIRESSNYFECALYSSEVDLFGPLENVLCSEIDFGISEVIDEDFIKDYRTMSNDIVVPTIDYGKGVSLPKLKLGRFDDGDWNSSARKIPPSCRLATTGNKTLSGLSSIDGYIPVTGDRILVHLQTTTSENGVYIADSGSWERAEDFPDPESCIDYAVFVQYGSANKNKWFIQTALTGDFSFNSGITAGQRIPNWVLTKGSSISFLVQRRPISEWLEKEFTLPKMPNIFGTEEWEFTVDWDVAILSGTPGITLRVHLRTEDGELVNVIDDNQTTTGAKTSTGTVSALVKYTHVLISLFVTDYNSGVFPSVTIGPIPSIEPINIVPNFKAEWVLPCIKFYRAIEEILGTLGPYTVEYPNNDSSYFERLLLTYSREYYGYYDKTIAVEDTNPINLSKFILPDISQKQLLTEWIYRTQSLIRVKNGVIELKPIQNIINTKVSTAVDWTSKRVKIDDKIKYEVPEIGQTNIFRDEDSLEDLDIIRGLGVTPSVTVSNEGSFLVSNTKLKDQSLIYESVFSSSQVADDNQFISSTLFTWAPVYDWDSVDRFDFKNSPKLRILQGVTGGAFAPNQYIEETSLSSTFASYRYLASTFPGAVWSTIISKSYNGYVTAINKTKLIERFYLLSDKDISNLDLFKPVFDNGSYFLISKIENYVPGFPVKVVMLKI